MLESKNVVCVNCKEKVVVKLVPYGEGHIAMCPKCGHLICNLGKLK